MMHFVTVANNLDMFNRTIRDNPFMNPYPIHVYDNTRDNIGVPKRYNDFIQNHLPEDSWVVFCHQDFAFEEDISDKLAALDRSCIYGPIGAGPTRQLVLMAAFSRYRIERSRIGFYPRTKEFGRITQKTADKTITQGQFIRKPVKVDTVDCCCMMVHSSLIRSSGLKFDENLDWHLYAEDFCLNARYKNNIETMAVQLKCTHYSAGTLNCHFHDNLAYVKKKFNTTVFSTTCYDGYARF